MTAMRTCSLSKWVCSSSGEPQPEDQFRWLPVSGKFTKTCAECRKRNAKHQEIWRDLNPEKEKATTAVWRDNNKKLLAAYSKQWREQKKGRR